jgi:transglutaminase-like putative cysteine protease
MDLYIDRTAASQGQAATGRKYSFEIAAALCVALVGATAWAVLAADWVQGGGGAIVVAITSVIEAALLAQARAPRIATAIAAPFLGLAAIVPTTLAAMPAVPGQTVGTIAGHYVRALLTGLSSNQDWDFTVGLCAILFLCGYWLGWMALREHRGVLAVIPIFSVLATNVVNAAHPNPVALPEVIAVVLAIGVVAAAYLGSLGDRWAASRITALEGLGVGFGTSVAVVASVLTILALVLPPISTADISARLFKNGLGIGSSAKGPGLTVTGSASTIGFNDSVTLGGPLVSRPQLVMVYTVNTNAAVYIRVADDTIYKAGSWSPETSINDSDPDSTWTSIPFPLGLLPRDKDPVDGGVGTAQQTVSASFTLQANATGDQSLVPFTGDPESVDLPGTAQGLVADPQSDTLLTVDEVRLEQSVVNGTKVQTSAYVSTATEAQLSAAGTNYPAWTKPYTDLPDDSTHGVETITALAKQWTAGLTDPYDQATAIEEHLRNGLLFQYTLNPPQDPQAGIWPLVYFLTTSHKGYCQYFASAMGSMLRSLNIPTRLVSGYGPGTTRAQSGRSGGREQEVSTSDAHSWVEAYFPGYGWIPFEPTPPSSQGDYLPFPRGQNAVTGVSSAPTPSARPATTPKPIVPNPITPNSISSQKSGAALPEQVVIALAVLGAIVVLFVAVVLWFLLPRSLTGAWRRVETLGAISGVDRRRAETHRAFAARLARARPQAESALRELATVTARAEFSASGASGRERAQALRTWRRALFAATLRPKRSPG